MAKTSEQAKIGFFIKKLREEKGMTQLAFAKALETAQSAVARIESGKQNLTLDQLAKISKVLEHKIVSMSDESVDFQIEGGHKLKGTIETHFSKNGAVALIPAALINSAPTILHGIPKIEEVFRLIELVSSLGVQIRWIDKNSIEITPPKKFSFANIHAEAAKKIRVSL